MALGGRLSWSEPQWIAIGLAVAIVVTLVWHRSLVDLSRRQQWISWLARLVGVMLLSAALAGLSWEMVTDRRCVVLCIDQSASVRGADLAWCRALEDQFATLRGDHRLKVVPFASKVGVASDGGAKNGREEVSSFSAQDQLATNLEQAVEAARMQVPADFRPHLVVASDWNETAGQIIRSAVSTGVPISTVVLEPETRGEVQVVALSGPAEARVGQPFELKLVVNSQQAVSARLELYRDELQVDLGSSANLRLQPGENRFPLIQQIDEPRTSQWTVRIVPDRDGRTDDNQASLSVTATGPTRMLILDPEPSNAAWFQSALEQQEIRVEVREAAGAPRQLDQWLAFDVVCLSNVAADAFEPTQLDQLHAYVQDFGGGLIMLGGDQSFGLGGYAKTPIEELLPVGCDPEKDEQQPSLAMVLVIDRSGSMGGLKLDLAKDAARAAIERLGPRDQWGVVAFDNEPHWISPLQSAADKSVLIDSIGRLEAAGGTNLYPAMQAALDALRSTSATFKHVLVLSDGVSAPADDETLIAEMMNEQITTSTIALGEKADKSRLRKMAEQGGGRFYECDDPRAVPQVFVQETMRASQTTLQEEPFQPQRMRSTPVLRSVDLNAMPPLLGFVATRVKPTSELILATETGEPLLAWWRSGLGMTLAFTSDATSRWAADWLVWPDFGLFWAQCVRHVARTKTDDSSDVSIDQENDQTVITLDLADAMGRFLNGAHVRWRQSDGLRDSSSGGLQDVEGEMVQVGPGRYELRLVPQAGPQSIVLQATQEGRIVCQRTVTWGGQVSPELRLLPANRARAREVARLSGGLFEPKDALAVVNAPAPPVYRTVPLWKPLLMAALVVLLIDVALRRVDWRASR